MAKNLSELPARTTTASTDLIHVNTGGSNNDYRQTKANFLSDVYSALTLTGAAYTVNGVTFVFRKYGRIVVVSAGAAISNAIPTNGYAGNVTVDSAYYPIAAEIKYIQVTATRTMQVNLSAAGLFQFGYADQEIASGTTIRLTFVYVSAS